MSPEEADRLITVQLQRRTAAWVRRYTIEQCALIAERAGEHRDALTNERLTKEAMSLRAAGVAADIRALGAPEERRP